MKRIKEAIEACLEVEGLKSQGRTELVGVQFVEVQAYMSLKRQVPKKFQLLWFEL